MATTLNDAKLTVRVTFTSGSSSSANTSDFKLEAKRSMMFTNTSFSGSSDNVDFSSFNDFTNLKCVANSASVDIELFVATT